MCNVHPMTKSQDAMRRLFRFHAGRQGPLPAILPDGMALVFRNQRGLLTAARSVLTVALLRAASEQRLVNVCHDVHVVVEVGQRAEVDRA
jgi:hypothetical protein